MDNSNIGKVTYFDVEYANAHTRSICQIGLVCEDYATGEPYYPELDIYINPEDTFDQRCINIHGITPKKVKDSPTFPEVWKTIEKYFTNTIIIGHNVAAADLNALCKNLEKYSISIPPMYYVCTLDLSRKYIPRHSVPNYSMTSLCQYFDIDIDCAHNAFDDACANSDLFKTLVSTYSINIEDHIKKYSFHHVNLFEECMSDVSLRKAVSEFYGVVRGFSIDNVITDDEAQYIEKWKRDNDRFYSMREIGDIIDTIDQILLDGVVTASEVFLLQGTIKKYLDLISTSPVTLATQILDGILKGIIADGNVSLEECQRLQQWLYDNIYLSGHYPFDKVIVLLENALADMRITSEESDYITRTINDLLNPVETLKEQINDVSGKNVCLSGNFSYGSKQAMAKFVTDHGGAVTDNVTKSTDILIVGAEECEAFSNGTYGTKVAKAIKYNSQGCDIKIVKENDFFASIV